MSENSIQPMIRDLVFPSCIPPLVLPDEGPSCHGRYPMGLLMHRPWLEYRTTLSAPTCLTRVEGSIASEN
jgi:hypothetical protein